MAGVHGNVNDGNLFGNLFNRTNIEPYHWSNAQEFANDASMFVPDQNLSPTQETGRAEALVLDAATPTNSQRTITSEDSASDTGRRLEPASERRSPAYFIETTPGQMGEMKILRFICETQDRLPTEAEFQKLMNDTSLPLDKLGMWFGARLRLVPKGRSSPPTVLGLNLQAQVLADISKYISMASNTTCSTAHSRKGLGGKYRCTWPNCDYSTSSRDAWIRHEEKKQPQTFWHCIECRMLIARGGRRQPFITHRKDKFLPHAESCHPSPNAAQLRNNSAVPYEAPFIRFCAYQLASHLPLCNHYFATWKDRNEHYFQHYDAETAHNEMPIATRKRRAADDLSDEDDADDLDNRVHLSRRAVGPSPLGHIVNASQSMAQGRASMYNQHGYRGHMERTRTTNSGAGQRYNEVCAANPQLVNEPKVSHALAVKWLISVEDYRVIEARSGLPYLALKYTASECPQTCLETVNTLLSPTLPLLGSLDVLFRRALGLTIAMGYRHLWIDVLCGVRPGSGGPDAVYKQANLVLVVGQPRQHKDRIWHFTCDYEHLPTVLSWARQSVSFHHLQQLGHGAFSVVDKVELRPSREVFARKIMFCNNAKKLQGSTCLAEVEIMRKLAHPHIARFIAAYYDHNALHILMTPVADFDLRQYLSCPERYPAERQWLPTWFMSLAEALAYMHGKHCRHKDIKPANILISKHKVLLTDFGTSMDFSTTRSTSVGGGLMTPKYCAPEVAAHGVRGRSADIFSLGCVFVEMITVAMGKSLEELHFALKMGQDSSDRKAVYHRHLHGIVTWLQGLSNDRVNRDQHVTLQLIPAMIKRASADRPTAVAVARALCLVEDCDVDPEVTCHCSADAIHALPGVSIGNAGMGLLVPRKLQDLRLTIAVPFAMDLRSCTLETSAPQERGIGFSFLFQSQATRSARGCPFLQWMQLVEAYKPLFWNVAGITFRTLASASASPTSLTVDRREDCQTSTSSALQYDRIVSIIPSSKVFHIR